MMKNQKMLVLLCFISLIAAQDGGGGKKRVQFQRTIEQQRNDFNFGDPIKPKTKAYGVTPFIASQPSVQPGQVIFQKSAPNKSLLKQNVVNDNGPFMPSGPPPNFADQSAFLPQPQNLNAQLQENGGRHQIGPTPQTLAYTSPQRFYLPQNAPITRRFDGPNLPTYYGVPGQDRPSVPNFEAYNPIVENYVGQRDTNAGQIIVDPIDTDELEVINTTPQEAPYTGPETFTQLRQVTPLQPALTDPLAPDVTNNRGVFFPNQPATSGPFIATAPEPQLIAQPLEDGPYFVEPVRDPIVFFDPNSNQTLVYDPLRDYTRSYNPETDPELHDDTEIGAMQAQGFDQEQFITTATVNVNGGFINLNNPNGGAVQKSGGIAGIKTPKFWIIRRQQQQGYEKSAINGARLENPLIKSITKRNVNSGDPLLKSSEQSAKIIPIASITGNPAMKQQKGKPHGTEQLIIQLSQPKPEDPPKETKITQNQKASPQSKTKTSGYVKLVYSPIVEVSMGSRYKGFKAQGSSAATTIHPRLLYSLLLVISIPTLTAIFF